MTVMSRGPSWKRVFEHDPPLLSIGRRGSVFKSRTPGCEWTRVSMHVSNAHTFSHACTCVCLRELCGYVCLYGRV